MNTWASWNTWHAYEQPWCYLLAIAIWFMAIWFMAIWFMAIWFMAIWFMAIWFMAIWSLLKTPRTLDSRS